MKSPLAGKKTGEGGRRPLSARTVWCLQINCFVSRRAELTWGNDLVTRISGRVQISKEDRKRKRTGCNHAN